jgi:hypothetical protein
MPDDDTTVALTNSELDRRIAEEVRRQLEIRAKRLAPANGAASVPD